MKIHGFNGFCPCCQTFVGVLYKHFNDYDDFGYSVMCAECVDNEKYWIAVDFASESYKTDDEVFGRFGLL